ncbi:MAG TPA: ABC transporter permease [Terriglobia bacterium]|nr:ABC transporter permease [Terriglobia bacterium]
MPDEPFSLRLYRWLVKLYPAGFRDNYARLMEREFRDELNESTGAAGLALLWIRVLGDLAISVPLQFAREVAQDTRHTVRLWRRRPWQIGFAILALAIGIGANTGVFSVVNALLLRSLPFRDPERLAYLSLDYQPPHDSVRQFHEWRRESAYLADAAVFEQFDVNLGGAGEWRRAHTIQASWNFFRALGTRPVLGRTFAPGEDVDGTGWGPSGRNAVAVIGYGLWQDLFGGDPQALGATIRLDGNPLTVIGVAPPGFDYPGKAAIWKPAAFAPGNNGWETVGRLKPGITWSQARAAFAAEAGRLWPNRTQLEKLKDPFALTGLRDELAGPARRGSLVLMACAGLILLIACTNVANLLMARTADRAAEFSIRSALGASRARLSQQLMTECVLLSLAACAVGIFVALWTTSVTAKLQPAALAAQAYSLVDGRVLGFAIAASVFTGLLFGVLPAMYASRVPALQTRGSSDARGSRLIRETLVAVQVMLTVVLLTAAISTGRAFAHLMHVDRGFDCGGLATVNVSLEGTTHKSDASRRSYFEEALARVRRLPGVESASATEFLPLYATAFIGGRFQVNGRLASKASMVNPVLPDYFRTMGGRILWGREFTDAEVRDNAKVALINERFASEFGAPAEAVGREIVIDNDHWKIIGVVKTMDYMTEGADGYETFVPDRSPGSFFSTFVVRVNGRADDRLAMIRATIQAVDREVPVFGVKTMEQRLDDVLARPEFYKTAVLCITSFALLLVVIGIYGIVSYTVARRTREMGIRLALGTTPKRLRVRLLWEGLAPIAGGAIPGIAGAVLSGRLLETLVEGSKSVNAATYASCVLFIAFVAAIGIWAATRPIARLEITEILRTE